MSRSVDRAFIGIDRPPKYQDHKTTGAILIPIAMAADLITLPIQAVLMIYGDNYPFEKERYIMDLDFDPRFQKMSDRQKNTARAELASLVQPGAVSADQGLVLREDRHWEVMSLNPEVRAKLIARADAAAPPRPSLAKAH